jgi:hypothetical protein
LHDISIKVVGPEFNFQLDDLQELVLRFFLKVQKRENLLKGQLVRFVSGVGKSCNRIAFYSL